MMILTDATKELLTTLANHGGVCSAKEIRAWMGLALDECETYAQGLVRNRLLRAHKLPAYADTIYQLSPTGMDLGLGVDGRGNSTRICRLDVQHPQLTAGFVRAYTYAHASAQILMAKTAEAGIKTVQKNEPFGVSANCATSVEYVTDGERKLLLHFPTTNGGLPQQIGQRLSQWSAHDSTVQHVFVLPAEAVNAACTILHKNGMPEEAIPVGSLDQFLQHGLLDALANGTCWQSRAPDLIKPGESINTPIWISPSDALSAFNALDKILETHNPPTDQLLMLYQYVRLCRSIDRYLLTTEERSKRKRAIEACLPSIHAGVTKVREARQVDLGQIEKQTFPDWSRDRVSGTCWNQSRFTQTPVSSKRFAVLFHTHNEVHHG